MVKLFVGNLNPQSKAADLRKKFEAYGKVTECDIVNNYGFVHMESESDAEAALVGLQDSILDGVKINVERSHGKRGGPGPMRRREGRFRDMPPDRFRGPPPPRYMGGGPPLPPPRMAPYGPAWDDGYGGPYGPPPPPMRGNPRDIPAYDYPTNGTGGRYPPDRDPIRPAPRGPREPLPPPAGPGYRAPPVPEPIPPPRDYPSKGAPPRARYDNFDGYGEYDRYREPPPQAAPRSSEYYDNYGNYSSGGGYDDYRDTERPPAAGYDSGYDYGYYDYGNDARSPAPPRYAYGRP